MYSRLRKRYKKIGACVTEDAIYNSRLVNLYINMVMKSGKKNIARTIVWKSLDALSTTNTSIQKTRTKPESGEEVRKKENQGMNSPLAILECATKRAAPQIEFKSSKARFGKKSKPVPIEMRSYRSSKVAIKWIVKAARALPTSRTRPFWVNLAKAISSTAQGKGYAITQKKALHKRAQAALVKKRRPKK